MGTPFPVTEVDSRRIILYPNPSQGTWEATITSGPKESRFLFRGFGTDPNGAVANVRERARQLMTSNSDLPFESCCCTEWQGFPLRKLRNHPAGYFKMSGVGGENPHSTSWGIEVWRCQVCGQIWTVAFCSGDDSTRSFRSHMRWGTDPQNVRIKVVQDHDVPFGPVEYFELDGRRLSREAIMTLLCRVNSRRLRVGGFVF